MACNCCWGYCQQLLQWLWRGRPLKELAGPWRRPCGLGLRGGHWWLCFPAAALEHRQGDNLLISTMSLGQSQGGQQGRGSPRHGRAGVPRPRAAASSGGGGSSSDGESGSEGDEQDWVRRACWRDEGRAHLGPTSRLGRSATLPWCSAGPRFAAGVQSWLCLAACRSASTAWCWRWGAAACWWLWRRRRRRQWSGCWRQVCSTGCTAPGRLHCWPAGSGRGEAAAQRCAMHPSRLCQPAPAAAAAAGPPPRWRLDQSVRDTTSRRQLEALRRLPAFTDANRPPPGEVLLRLALLGSRHAAHISEQPPVWVSGAAAPRPCTTLLCLGLPQAAQARPRALPPSSC